MASFFGHALVSIAIGTGFLLKVKDFKFWLLGVFCAVVPDADVISFKLRISYGDLFGHRGFNILS